jgi:hypothetical protein
LESFNFCVVMAMHTSPGPGSPVSRVSLAGRAMHSVLVLLATASVGYSGDTFRYLVSNEIKSDKLHYYHHFDLTITDDIEPSPRLHWYSRYEVMGCTAVHFPYTSESCRQTVSPNRLKVFLSTIRALPLRQLEALRKPEHDPAEHWHARDEPAWTFGSIHINGTSYYLRLPLDHPMRVKLHALILAFLDEVAPKSIRESTFMSIQGDFAPAIPVTFETLLRSPEKFDSKRIRLTGYFEYVDFESSRFSASKGDDYERSLHLGSISPFVPPASVRFPIDGFHEIEGFFSLDRNNLTVWAGWLERVTRIKELKP